jgi:sulfur carrier protein
MKIQINGQTRDFSSPLSLAALVEQLGMKTDRVAVELNGTIAPRDRWAATHLAEADRLEIVHFVGGGSRRESGLRRTWVRLKANSDSGGKPTRVGPWRNGDERFGGMTAGE